jgi:hypothetical protein
VLLTSLSRGSGAVTVVWSFLKSEGELKCMISMQQNLPQYLFLSHLWFMGGRIFPGETPIQSCQRLLRRELKLDISSDRFVAVCAQAFAFGMREQEPKEHGTTDAQFCYKVQLLNDDEVQKVVLDESEYSESEWKLPSEIIEGNYHPALKFAVGNMIAGNALEKMERKIEEGGSDEEIAVLAREFMKRRKDVDEVLKTSKDYKLVSKELNYETTVNSRY